MLKPVDPALFLFNAPPHHFGPVSGPSVSPPKPRNSADKPSTRCLDRPADWLPQKLFLGATGGTQTHARRTGES